MCIFKNINKIDKSLFNLEFTERHLEYTYKTRTRINQKCMDKLQGEYHRYKPVLARNI